MLNREWNRIVAEAEENNNGKDSRKKTTKKKRQDKKALLAGYLVPVLHALVVGLKKMLKALKKICRFTLARY